MFAVTVVGYLAGAVLTYGLVFAYFQREFPATATERRGTDIAVSLLFAITWPLGLPVHLLMVTPMGSGNSPFRHGLKYRLREPSHA